MGWVLLKTLASLMAVLGAMFGLVLLMKKYLYGFQATKTNSVSVDLLGQRLIQPKRSIAVVKVLNKIFVVGMTEEGMSTLGEIADPGILQWVDTALVESENAGTATPAARGTQSSTGRTFAQHLSENLGFLRPRTQRSRTSRRTGEADEEL